MSAIGSLADRPLLAPSEFGARVTNWVESGLVGQLEFLCLNLISRLTDSVYLMDARYEEAWFARSVFELPNTKRRSCQAELNFWQRQRPFWGALDQVIGCLPRQKGVEGIVATLMEDEYPTISNFRATHEVAGYLKIDL